MTDITDLFFQLLRVSVGRLDRLGITPKQEEWNLLLAIARKQGLAGICFSGVERLPEEQSPGERLIMEWMGEAVKAQRRNKKLNKTCKNLVDEFGKKGYTSCILKGQSNQIYYPTGLGTRRTAGDIDIWLFPKDNHKPPVKQTMELLEGGGRIVSLAYLHAELRQVDTVAVEAHFRPTFLNEPLHNHRLQKWYRENKADCIMERQTADGITIPMLKPVYNIIFQLVHIYRHLLDEGIGLRQLLDYYYLLTGTVKSLSATERTTVEERLSSFGLNRIAGSVMYVLREVFLMDSAFMIVPANEKYGKQLLNEIMIAGNFGHYDPRLKDIGAASHDTGYQIRHAVRRFKRNLRFLTSYPSEVCCEPFARLIHFWWRKFRLWRF